MLFAVIAMVAANLYKDWQRTKCSEAFWVTLVDGPNPFGLEADSDCCIPGTISRGIAFLDSRRIQLGAFEVEVSPVDHLLRWAGSATILVLRVIR